MAPYKTALTPNSMATINAQLYAYVVEGRLDEARVKGALELVVKRWPLLGGGYTPTKNPSGYSIVETNASPPFLYTHASRTQESLPNVYPLPTAITSPRISDARPWTQSLALFSPHPNAPLLFNDWVEVPATSSFFGPKAKPAAPILYLHVGNFDSHTVVGLRVTHAVFDGSGSALLMRELEKAMTDPVAYAAGPEIRMAFPGEDGAEGGLMDPLKKFKELQGPVPTEFKGWSVWGFWKLLSYGLRILWRRFTRSYKRKCFLVPQEYLTNAAAKFNKQIKREDPESKAFVSAGDVIAAVLWKTAIKQIPASNSPTALVGLANMRNFTSLLPTPWLGACLAISHTTSTVADIQSAPLLQIALSVRQSLKDLTPETVEKNTQWRLSRAGKKGRMVPLGAGTNVRTVGISNRVKTKAAKVDFSGAAITGESKTLHSFSAGRPETIHQDYFSIKASLDDTGFEIIGAAVEATWQGLFTEFEELSKA